MSSLCFKVTAPESQFIKKISKHKPKKNILHAFCLSWLMVILPPLTGVIRMKHFYLLFGNFFLFTKNRIQQIVLKVEGCQDLTSSHLKMLLNEVFGDKSHKKVFLEELFNLGSREHQFLA